ncbi:hypothetical protein BK640_30570 [Pseudomonas protegens]|nr:hypothetical protein BK639_21250 [Pseudomonas protegens]ROL94685.1 hypothetical protein BK640_30570 [Pseudomonas protegens]ROM04004.1 hypothetical protein BK642_20015 [Pseudomonas protegens]ROM05822.1 hypothetical protein BK641_13635 [Pseudomonas protegens]
MKKLLIRLRHESTTRIFCKLMMKAPYTLCKLLRRAFAHAVQSRSQTIDATPISDRKPRNNTCDFNSKVIWKLRLIRNISQ